MNLTSALTSTYEHKPPLRPSKNKANQTRKCKGPEREILRERRRKCDAGIYRSLTLAGPGDFSAGRNGFGEKNLRPLTYKSLTAGAGCAIAARRHAGVRSGN